MCTNVLLTNSKAKRWESERKTGKMSKKSGIVSMKKNVECEWGKCVHVCASPEICVFLFEVSEERQAHGHYEDSPSSQLWGCSWGEQHPAREAPAVRLARPSCIPPSYPRGAYALLPPSSAFTDLQTVINLFATPSFSLDTAVVTSLVCNNFTQCETYIKQKREGGYR